MNEKSVTLERINLAKKKVKIFKDQSDHIISLLDKGGYPVESIIGLKEISRIAFALSGNLVNLIGNKDAIDSMIQRLIRISKNQGCDFTDRSQKSYRIDSVKVSLMYVKMISEKLELILSQFEFVSKIAA